MSAIRPNRLLSFDSGREIEFNGTAEQLAEKVEIDQN
jgi:hypothetical protein